MAPKSPKPKSSGAGNGSSAEADAARKDPRFAKFETDPLYRLPSKKQTRVAVDSRFTRMFSDDAFTSRAKVDRYGRRLPKAKAGRDLQRLYRIEKPEKQRKGKEDGSRIVKQSLGGKDREYDANEEEDEDEDDDDDDDGGISIASDAEVERELRRVEEKGSGYDPARDGGFSESSSEEDTSDEESEEEDEEGEVEESGLAARQTEEVPKGEVSKRLAIVNLDWDNIRSVDLMVVLKSFAPSGGRIERVTVYPSEFGKERLEREELEGPPKELFMSRKGTKGRENNEGDEPYSEEEDEEEEEERIRKSIIQEDQGEDFDSDQLRKYQLERLRYYYAVVECSSKECANHIYSTVDGTEYLSTANFFDLRFIPDDTDFSDDKPRDSCRVVPEGYKPNEFSTHALQHSKVKLTWDADDTGRKEAQKRAFSRAEIDENDLKAYLASDSSEDENGLPEPEIVDATEAITEEREGRDEIARSETKLSKKDAARQRMRELLGLPAEPAPRKTKEDGPVGDMQITFSSALSGSKGNSVFENEPIPDETTLEKYVRKERERKARRKEKMKAARRGETEQDDKVVEEPGEVEPEEDLGFDDPFFTEPVNNQVASNSTKKEEKRKKRAEREAREAQSAVERAELEHLMADENEEAAAVRHFDISELKKAEKTLRKTKGKKAKLKAGEKAAIEAKDADDFQMDVADPRFQMRMDKPQFAVDPSHPSFSKTEGMQKLLEARRRKRAREAAADDQEISYEKRRKGEIRSDRDKDDLKDLVQRLKGKKKR